MIFHCLATPLVFHSAIGEHLSCFPLLEYFKVKLEDHVVLFQILKKKALSRCHYHTNNKSLISSKTMSIFKFSEGPFKI